ncbi:MAG: tRNA (adenosine(37)-N6)-dimethylallyltransferase MiaA [Oscillospiraceae bacterium]|nr:tRNA (adenosine(37)-N6)-dimethylallyltransferase MiaA [Oscillospiraceae bacterium]
MTDTPSPLIVITGPTATGKTALGIALCRALDGEVISADSMQIYKGMDIGTAKPTAEELAAAPHHMIDVADPREDWSVARWAGEAARWVEDIRARGKQPIVVGGTGLYIEALLTGRDYSAAPGEDGLRQRLSAEYDALGGDAFRAKLSAVDPERAQKLSPADKKRLVRAMEVYLLTGETITVHDARSRVLPPRYASVRFALSFRDRAALYERIRRRVDAMAAAGLFEEVEGLLRGRLSPDSTAMQAIGYKEAAAALRGDCSREEAVEAIKQASTRYAKRQLTWLRRDQGLHWLYREDAPGEAALTDAIFQFLRP